MTTEVTLGGVVRMNGKYLGRLSNGIYMTDRGPLHYFDKYRGFGISNDVLMLLKGEHCFKVVVRYRSPEWSRDYELTLDGLMMEPIVQPPNSDPQRIMRVPLEDHNRLHWALVDAREAW